MMTARNCEAPKSNRGQFRMYEDGAMRTVIEITITLSSSPRSAS